MGLNYARKQQAKKHIADNKARAHAGNHKKAHARFAAEEAAKAQKADAAASVADASAAAAKAAVKP